MMKGYNITIKIVLVIIIVLIVIVFFVSIPKETYAKELMGKRFPIQSYNDMNEHVFLDNCYDNNVKLIINDIDYSLQTYVHYNETRNTFELPLLFISKQLGAKIYKLDEKSSYLISFFDEDYILDTEINKLSVYNQSMNIIGDPKPITNPYANNDFHIEPSYKVFDNDFIVENIVIEHFLYMRNADIQIKDNIVTINTVQPTLYELKIYGKVIASVKVDENKDYAEIPFLTVVKELAGKVYKIAPDMYLIKINGNKVYFNSKNIILSETKDGSNLLGSASGGKLWTYYKISGGEVFIDSSSMQVFLNRVGYKCVFDNQEKVVNITK